MSNEKEHLIQLAIERLQAQIEFSKKNIEQERELIRGAPTARESWSDTTRSQRGGVVDALQSKQIQTQQALAVLKQLNLQKTTVVEGGALVEIEEGGIKTFYLIVPGILIQFEIDGKVVEIVSPASPVARALFGHKAGEIITIKVPAGIRTIKILEVQ